MKQLKLFLSMSLLAAMGIFVTSCNDDDEDVMGDALAVFSTEASEADPLTITFLNFSENASTSTWSFGDGATSTEKEPTHTYASGGSYEVTLVVTSNNGTESVKTQEVLVDPVGFLAGDNGKTWKLMRDGTSMLLAADPQYSQIYWDGLTNNGKRPCYYDDSFTFNPDGTFTFDDNDTFWAEYGLFNNVADCDSNVTPEGCIDVAAGTLQNACGDDISAFLAGAYTYDFNTTSMKITLLGEGAWMGVPKLGTGGERLTPDSETTFDVVLKGGGTSGVDTMFVSYTYDGAFWPITYVSYANPADEPELVTEFVAPPCEPLAAVSPSEISHTFASNEATEWTLLQPIESGAGLELGVDDPADASGAKVGKYVRNAGVDYQELQFKLDPANAINFENLTTISMEVYLPSSNDYSSTLTKNVFVGFGATTCPPNWWEDLYQYEQMDVALDEWVTITFDLSTPSSVSVPDNGANVYERNDLDMIFIAIGGGGHGVGGEFYMRNFSIK